jgi:hypothetical protein
VSVNSSLEGFAFEFGSTLTILTTAATGRHHGTTGIFTGVALDETELKFKRGAKHISVSMTGDYLEDKDYCEQEPQQSKDKDLECHKPIKEEDPCEWGKPDNQGKDDKCHKPHKGDQEKQKCEVKKEGEFLVLALTSPSFPFKAGQIVWISVDQIVSVTVVCRN